MGGWSATWVGIVGKKMREETKVKGKSRPTPEMLINAGHGSKIWTMGALEQEYLE